MQLIKEELQLVDVLEVSKWGVCLSPLFTAERITKEAAQPDRTTTIWKAG
jgi:hypothetical protein